MQFSTGVGLPCIRGILALQTGLKDGLRVCARATSDDAKTEFKAICKAIKRLLQIDL